MCLPSGSPFCGRASGEAAFPRVGEWVIAPSDASRSEADVLALVASWCGAYRCCGDVSGQLGSGVCPLIGPVSRADGCGSFVVSVFAFEKNLIINH